MRGKATEGSAVIRDDETDRQRKAAQLALNQLDWCVEYLRSIRKYRISDQLARNCAEIRRRLHEYEQEQSRGT